MFAFRVATQLGIGHVMRMKWLALELQNRGCQSIFILDYQSENLLPFLEEIDSKVFFLAKYFSYMQEDAQQCLQIMQTFPDIATVILDSYDLGIKWEQTLKKANKKLVVFDDLAREHYCDMLFDAKWLGEGTSLRYQNKLPDNCQTYLGPQYAILSPAYKNILIRNSTPTKTKKVLMSLGGGGDLSIIVKLVTALYQQLKNQSKIETTIVIGPKAENVALVEQLAKQHDQVTLLYQPKCLAEYYRKTDLFVGALGTSLYELAATKTPAITFSLSANQQNNYCDLADLGHYFHLPTFDAEQAQQVNNLACLIDGAIKQLPRVRALRSFPNVDINGEGVANIVDILLGNKSQYMVVAKKPPVSSIHHTLADEEKISLNDAVYLRKVNDKDINLYRLSRNLPNNSERMTIQTEILALEHYLWWFNNHRQSYVLYQNEQPLLYIWHQVYHHQDKQYLYGGWFTAQGEIPFNIAMLALKWQLDYTRELFPQSHWLAVINKENKFVNLLNQYMGFSTTDIKQDTFIITQKLFPQALASEFNFVELDFDKSNK